MKIQVDTILNICGNCIVQQRVPKYTRRISIHKAIPTLALSNTYTFEIIFHLAQKNNLFVRICNATTDFIEGIFFFLRSFEVEGLIAA